MIDTLWGLYDRVQQIDPKKPKSDERDRFILSKRHGSLALYAILVEEGFFPASELERFVAFESPLGGHVDCNKVRRRDSIEVHDQLSDVFAGVDHKEAHRHRRAQQMIEQGSSRRNG